MHQHDLRCCFYVKLVYVYIESRELEAIRTYLYEGQSPWFPHGWLKIPGFSLRLGGPNGIGFIGKPSARDATFWSSIPASCGLILDFTWNVG